MNDITEIFKKAVFMSDEYDKHKIAYEIEKNKNIWCEPTDDWGYLWYLISESDGKSDQEYYGYLSVLYPVALIMDNCPEFIINDLKKNNILIAKFEEPFSCSEEVLKLYTSDVNILDDRFLDDCNFELDDERLYYIYEGIPYITPYSFTFDEIR